MTPLFVAPPMDFVVATFFAMTVMIVVTFLLTRYRNLFRPSLSSLAVGVLSAVLLYLVFYAGNLAIGVALLPGLGTPSENQVYSLIASPSNPLYIQVAVLAFDAVGYESFFRGVLVRRSASSLGPGSIFLAAAIDSVIHLLSLNPIWVVTTFIADSIWGLTYYYTGKSLSSSVTSHFLWDIAIFVVAPIH